VLARGTSELADAGLGRLARVGRPPPEAVGMELLDQPRGADRAPLTLRIACGDYDRTRPLVDGRIRPAGIEPTYVLEEIGQFCHRPVYEEYDVAEMSLSWYVAARMRGEPVIAFPIFPLRMPVHGYIFCRTEAPFTKPTDLIGKRVGTLGYRYTVNLWLRGILRDHYGVSPEQLRWFTTEEEGAGYVPPAGLDITILSGADPEQLLLAGEVDAVFSPVVLAGIANADPRLRRLFPDARAEFVRYVAATKIVPITHTMVIGEGLFERHPWIAESLVRAFREAQAVCDAAYREPKYLSAPDAVFTLEAQRQAFGAQPYSHGLRPNRHVLETFVRYAYEQGYIERIPAVDELFVPLADD
jgi:4,5-dihydroxyphthalate decarboxylase